MGGSPPLIKMFAWFVCPVILWASLKKRQKEDGFWGMKKICPPTHIVISGIALSRYMGEITSRIIVGIDFLTFVYLLRLFISHEIGYVIL